MSDWLYHPKRSWMWTTNLVYPYFFDEQSNSWMYFKSGTVEAKILPFWRRGGLPSNKDSPVDFSTCDSLERVEGPLCDFWCVISWH